MRTVLWEKRRCYLEDSKEIVCSIPADELYDIDSVLRQIDVEPEHYSAMESKIQSAIEEGVSELPPTEVFQTNLGVYWSGLLYHYPWAEIGEKTGKSEDFMIADLAKNIEYDKEHDEFKIRVDTSTPTGKEVINAVKRGEGVSNVADNLESILIRIVKYSFDNAVSGGNLERLFRE